MKVAISQLLILNHHLLISDQVLVLENTRVVPRPSNSNGHSFVDAIIHICHMALYRQLLSESVSDHVDRFA